MQLYPSNVPRGHEFLANAWMYRMTKDPKFLQTAQALHAQAGALYHNPVIGWSNPIQVHHRFMHTLHRHMHASKQCMGVVRGSMP
jgi:hypothetical protein